MKSKILLIFSIAFFSILLATNVSAVLTYGDWQDGSQNIEIDFGESIDFNADFFTMNPPMTINIKLYDSQYNLVHAFENGKDVNVYEFANTYSITESIYENTGQFTLVLSGSDSFPDTDSYSLSLKVNPISPPENNAPVITSTPVTKINETENYFYDVNANDADGDTLTYDLTQAPNWLTINSVTGEITGTSPSISSDTNHNIEVSVSDGQDTDTQTYTLIVKDVPVTPTNNAPVANEDSFTTDENVSISISLSASDADRDDLEYFIDSNPENGTLSNFDSQTGVLTYTPNPGFSGTDSFTFYVNDGIEDSNIAKVSININDVVIPENNAPVITSTPVTKVNESQNYFYDVDASDADGDTLTYDLTQAPNWLSIDNITGLINVTSPVVSNDTNYTIEISVSDGQDTDTQTYTLTVFNVLVPNSVPVITSTPGTEVDESSLYQYQITATDADNDSLTYLLTESPGWLTMNSTTGLVSGIAPKVSSEISYDIRIEVSDGKDVGIQEYVLTIDNIPSGDDEDGNDGSRGITRIGGLGNLDRFDSGNNVTGEITFLGGEVEKAQISGWTIFFIILLIATILLIILIIIYMKR